MARVAAALGSSAAAGRTVLRATTPALALALAGFTVACADGANGPTAPQPAPAAAEPAYNATSTGGTNATALLWNSPVSQASVSAVIGSAGGSLAIPNGARLIVPRGAVSTDVTFRITRRPGAAVAYDFQSHGTRFAVPLTVQHPTAGTNFSRLAYPAAVEGAYFADPAGINASTGAAVVSEFRPTSISADRAAVAFSVSHFSGYITTTGRSRT